MASTTDSTSSATIPVATKPVPLEAGDHLDQKTFHARYEAMPPDTRAELIGGVVYMMSPMKNPHGKHTRLVSFWLYTYELATSGVEGGDSVTTILGQDSEPQPDASLYIRPDKGGQVRINEDDYTEGAPELIVEVASSTESYDLHSKKRDYEAAGVCEYIVVALRQKQVFWFVLRDGSYEALAAGDDGIYRSRVFPGLWLDPQSLLNLDGQRIRAVLQQGLESSEHAEFVRKLDGKG